MGRPARASNVSGDVYLYRSIAILLYFSHLCVFVTVLGLVQISAVQVLTARDGALEAMSGT